MAARAFLGAGDLYISRYESGAWLPYEGPFEADEFSVKPNSELKEQVSKGKTTYGQVIESVSLAKPADFTATLTEVNKQTLALALLGSSAALTQTGSSVVDEVVTAAKGKWLALSKSNVSSVVVKNSAGSTTYVAGTDYEVNATLGWVKILDASAIADASSLKISFTAGAVTGTRIKGGTASDIRARFKLDGVNKADGSACIVTVHEAVVSASDAVDFLAGDFGKVKLPGRLKTPQGMTEPFTVDLL